MSTFAYSKPGLGNVGSYQASGAPFVTSSIAPALDVTTSVVNFPRVTNYVVVKNVNETEVGLRVSFNQDSVIDNENYILLARGESFAAKLRTTDIHLMSDSADDTVRFSIIAGLTNIDRREMTQTAPVPPNLLAWVQKQKLVANDPDGSPEGDYFGARLSIFLADDEQKLIVSAFGDEGPSGELYVGCFYIFQKIGEQYTQTEKVELDEFISGSLDFAFLYPIGVNNSGDKILVSSPNNSCILLESGSIGFEKVQEIFPGHPSNTNLGFGGGFSKFSSDNTILIINSQYDGRYATNGGTVSVYESSSAGYQFRQEITASYNTDGVTPDGSVANDSFGSHVVLSQDKTKLIIGSQGDDEAGTNAGAVYIFQSSSVGYQQVQKITASYNTLGLPETTKPQSYFGEFLSAIPDCNLLAVGARGNSENGNGAGAVYLFASGSFGYQQVQKLTASNDPDGSLEKDLFSRPQLSKDGTVLAVAATNDEQDGGSGDYFNGAGAIYMFHSGSNGYQQVQKLTSSFNTDGTPETPGPLDSFGEWLIVADDGKTLIAGATDNDENGIDAGAVYVFKYTRDY